MTEETLSDKILSWDGEPFLLSVEDVKDFIKKLKEIGKTKVSNEGDYCYILSEEEIDKLAGKELLE